jgi:hypothetical protein
MVGMWGAPETNACIHEQVPAPVAPTTIDERYCNATYRAAQNHHRLARSIFPLDVLPSATTCLGPGSLALFCGSQAGFAEDTVWFYPCIEEISEPESLPPLRFDSANPWWKTTEAIIRTCADQARGKYIVGCPDLIENVDVLSSLRGAQTLMMDMLERPDWVEKKIWEINALYYEVYQRIYDIIKLPDGSSAFGAFYVWGPGKTAKLQCDASAMFSPEMYKQFVVPALTAQCKWLDNSIYHLDGTQAMCHLDNLLSIEPLDAIEWTPQAGIEPGGNKRWHDLYKRILAAGKSVQVVNVELDDIKPLIDAIGTKGVYMLIQFKNQNEADRALKIVEAYY